MSGLELHAEVTVAVNVILSSLDLPLDLTLTLTSSCSFLSFSFPISLQSPIFPNSLLQAHFGVLCYY